MTRSIRVREFVARANLFFSDSPAEARPQRIALAEFVRDTLHQARAYAGFNYLQPYGVPGSDDSRVFFYVHRSAQ